MGKNPPRGFSGGVFSRWLFLSLQRCPWGTLLPALLTCPCVPSACCALHQGRGLHRVLGHGHCPLACRIPVRRVLYPGVLPAALAGGRRSQVSATKAPGVRLVTVPQTASRYARDYSARSHARNKSASVCPEEFKGQALICEIRLRHKNTSFLFCLTGQINPFHSELKARRCWRCLQSDRSFGAVPGREKITVPRRCRGPGTRQGRAAPRGGE